jgi:hypothetical protein
MLGRNLQTFGPQVSEEPGPVPWPGSHDHLVSSAGIPVGGNDVVQNAIELLAWLCARWRRDHESHGDREQGKDKALGG